MFSNFLKPLNILCIFFYVIFMIVAMNTTAVNALVFFVSEDLEKPVYTAGSMTRAEVPTNNDKTPVVAIQFRRELTGEKLEELKKIAEPQVTSLSRPAQNEAATDLAVPQPRTADLPQPAAAVKVEEAAVITMKSPEPTVVAALSPSVPAVTEDSAATRTEIASGEISRGPSAVEFIKAVAFNKWEYAELLDRYIVRYDPETYIVLTIRPKLQKQLEEVFKKYSTRIGAGIVQDPASGEILAITSCHKNETLDIESDGFKSDHWALKATFPVASIVKVVTAAAGIDTGKITPNSNFIAWKKSYMKVWKAFATSHNGVFGKIARKTGKEVVEKYLDAFGFNKTLFFDLPVGKSVASMPSNSVKMGQAAAGLDRDFLVSPLHVATIISTVLNRGKTMKPYLVDYVVRKNKVIFRRKPFQIARPIKEATAKDLYKMMYTTTAVGTGKRGFGGYRQCPDLAKICGGKTGTLTGASPHYLYTWFGGFTKATGRDLCIVTLVGQQNHNGTKAASIAGQLSYELFMNRKQAQSRRVANNRK